MRWRVSERTNESPHIIGHMTPLVRLYASLDEIDWQLDAGESRVGMDILSFPEILNVCAAYLISCDHHLSRLNG